MKNFATRSLFLLGLFTFILVGLVLFALRFYPGTRSISDAGNPTEPKIDRGLISFETGEDVSLFENKSKAHLNSSGPDHQSIDAAMKSYVEENRK